MDNLEQQLKTMFEHDTPPQLRTWQLERLAKEREQRLLLLVVSLLSCGWNVLGLAAALLALEQEPTVGAGMLCALLVTLFSAGFLAAAILKTEQPKGGLSMRS